MSALALQKALGARLAAFPELVALVPPANIVDCHGPPQAFPCITLGEGQEITSDLTHERHHLSVVVTLHVWVRETGVTGVKAIASAIQNAIRSADLVLEEGRVLDLYFAGARFLSDPMDTNVAHGLVTLEALVEEGV